MFGNSDQAATKTNPPGDKEFTANELLEFDGSDDSKPIYLAIKGTGEFPSSFSFPSPGCP
jgi:hypothetical protein